MFGKQKNLNKFKKIVETLEENSIKIKSNQETTRGDIVLLADNLLFLYEPEEDRFNVSFHISTRPDVSALYFKNLSEDLNNLVCNFNIMESHYIKFGGKNRQIIYGDEALQEYLSSIHNIVVNKFIDHHKQTAMIEDEHYGFNC